MNWYAIRHKPLRDWLRSPGLYRSLREDGFDRRFAADQALHASRINTRDIDEHLDRLMEQNREVLERLAR